MAFTRRGFVQRIGRAAAGSVTGAVLAARGFEDLVAAQGLGQRPPEFAAGTIRLGSNENPYGPGPHVVAAVERALRDEGNRYTRMPGQLIEQIASTFGLSPASVLVGAGSADLLRAAVLAHVGAERPLVAAVPTYEGPVRVAESLRLPLRLVPLLPTLSVDIDRMVERGRGAGLVFLCNPDNPSGTFHGRDRVAAAIEALAQQSPDTTVLIDEAYFDCADDPSYGSVAALAAAQPRVIVTRTFSKIHGLAGMRIGYAIAHAATIDRLRPYVGQSVVSCAGAAAAMASLADVGYYRRQQAQNRAGRASLARILTDLGLAPVPSQTNFVMVDVRRDVRRFASACR
jgi:histidinol-phosphate aminotransferase